MCAILSLSYAQEPSMNDELKDSILDIFEASLEAQLRAVRRLRHGDMTSTHPSPNKGLSQVDMAFDVLKKPAPRFTSPNSWIASTPPLASPSIARASSLLSPRRSPATTASCAPIRTLNRPIFAYFWIAGRLRSWVRILASRRLTRARSRR
jgi:hypothetical protein